jgi:hypothetical protein
MSFLFRVSFYGDFYPLPFKKKYIYVMVSSNLGKLDVTQYGDTWILLMLLLDVTF